MSTWRCGWICPRSYFFAVVWSSLKTAATASPSQTGPHSVSAAVIGSTVIYAKMESAEWSDMLQWSQRVIDLADGDPSKGTLLFGSPLALAFTTRALGRYCLGRRGWRDDLREEPGHGSQRRPYVLRRGRHLPLLAGNTRDMAITLGFEGHIAWAEAMP